MVLDWERTEEERKDDTRSTNEWQVARRCRVLVPVRCVGKKCRTMCVWGSPQLPQHPLQVRRWKHLDNMVRMLLGDANKDEPQPEMKKVRRIQELEEKQLEENYLIDSCYGIFGACRHRTRFHRIFKEKQSVKSTSTDEGIKPERVDKDGWKGWGDEKMSPRLARSHDVIPPPGH